jgi:ribose-phosphate pyrophosphokinase
MRLFLPMPGNETLAKSLAKSLAKRTAGELGVLETRRFPDGESYVRLRSDVSGRDVAIVCTLAHPDEQFLRLVFTARAARELGAASVTLIAPYLAYMRQDIRFHPGEAITSSCFAGLISGAVDRLITVDPHLHRHKALAEIYSIPAAALHAAPLLAEWIARETERPVIIGPDIESEQWVSQVAGLAGAPYLVLRKERHGDRDVDIALPDLDAWRDRQPVLIDDIVSSGRTMIGACEGLLRQGLPKPACLAVHALFEEAAYDRLSELARIVVSTDTIPHPTNGISVAALIAEALAA